MKNEIEWKRVFVRSGFLFDETATGFSFSNEKRHNVEYLGKVFRHLGLFEQSNVSFVRSIFQPAVLMVDEGKKVIYQPNPLDTKFESLLPDMLVYSTNQLIL